MKPDAQEIRIRKASARDLPFVISLSDRVFKIYGPYGRILAITFFDSNVRTLVAHRGESRVGFVMISRRRDSTSSKNWGEISAIAVEPRHHGTGIGKALLREAINYSRERGYSHLILHTAEQNSRARTLFESFGFRVRRSVRNYYPEGQTAYEMILFLDGRRTRGRRHISILSDIEG